MSTSQSNEHCACGARAMKRCEDFCSGGVSFACGRPLCAAHATCPKPAVEMRPLWSLEACETCGTVGYATRTQSRPKSESYRCDECEAAQRASDAADAEIAALKARIVELEALLAAATNPPQKDPAMTAPNTIKHLCSEARRIEAAHGFGADVRFGEDMALVHSEVSEALEAFRKDGETNLTWYTVKEGGQYREAPSPYHKPEGVPAELADVCIRIFAICERHGIDLERAIVEKMAYNETRPHRHGGKKL